MAEIPPMGLDSNNPNVACLDSVMRLNYHLGRATAAGAIGKLKEARYEWTRFNDFAKASSELCHVPVKIEIRGDIKGWSDEMDLIEPAIKLVTEINQQVLRRFSGRP